MKKIIFRPVNYHSKRAAMSAASWRIWAGDPPVRDTVPHPEGGGLPSRGGRVKTAYPGEI